MWRVVRQVRPHHEGIGPSPSFVSSCSQVGTTRSGLTRCQPATGEAKGWAMVLRSHRARRVLLRTGGDHAPGAGRIAESCDFLPRRSNHGAAEGLDRLSDVFSGARPLGDGLFSLIIFLSNLLSNGPQNAVSVANHAGNVHTPTMTLKNAALLALIGTILITAFLVWTFVFNLINVLRGLVPAVTLFSSLIYAFACFSVAVFFFVFHREQS
jgi:hypothetical protein